MPDGPSQPQPGAAPTPEVARAAHRHKTFEPTTILTAIGEIRAHILNLSATGALVHAPGGPARGERCTIRLAARDVAAEVMWTDGARFGIAFRCALRPDNLSRLLG